MLEFLRLRLWSIFERSSLFKRLLTTLLICVLNSTICLSAEEKPQPQSLPWPVKNVKFKNNGLLNITLGRADAPVVIHEISSVTCFHCAGFHKEVFPQIKKKYIDTGKVRLVLRHCPIDGVSLRAAMVLSQIPQKKRYDAIKKMWENQPKWFPDDFEAKNLKKFSENIAGFCGVSANQAHKYMTDDKLAEAVIKDRYELDNVIQIDGTPTFVINGDVVLTSATFKNIDKIIQKHLGKKG